MVFVGTLLMQAQCFANCEFAQPVHGTNKAALAYNRVLAGASCHCSHNDIPKQRYLVYWDIPGEIELKLNTNICQTNMTVVT